MAIAERENSSILDPEFLPEDFARSESPLSFEEYEDEEGIDKKAFELLTNAVITPEEIFPETSYQNRDDIYRELLWRTGSESEENDINEMYLLILGDRAYRYILKEAGLYKKFENDLVSAFVRSEPSEIYCNWISKNHYYPLQQKERRYIAGLLGSSVYIKRITKSNFELIYEENKLDTERYGKAIMDRYNSWRSIINDLESVDSYDDVFPTLFSSYIEKYLYSFGKITYFGDILVSVLNNDSDAIERILNKIVINNHLYIEDGYCEILYGYEGDRRTSDLFTLLNYLVLKSSQKEI